jgi:hypothetical protein
MNASCRASRTDTTVNTSALEQVIESQFRRADRGNRMICLEHIVTPDVYLSESEHRTKLPAQRGLAFLLLERTGEQSRKAAAPFQKIFYATAFNGR